MFSSNILLNSYMFLFKNSIMSTFFAFRGLHSSVCCLHEVLSDWSGILTKNIAGSSGIELPVLFASIESIDTFVSIDDFDTFSIVSPITRGDSPLLRFIYKNRISLFVFIQISSSDKFQYFMNIVWNCRIFYGNN